MDSERIGKALGIGTRVFSKAVSSAMTPDPARPARAGVQPAAERPAVKYQSAPTAAVSARDVAKGVQQAGGSLLKQTWRLSGVVMLETLGLFFGFLALFFLQGLWKHAADIHQPANTKAFQSYAVNIAMAALFLYFTVSSFVRAERRAKGRK